MASTPRLLLALALLGVPAAMAQRGEPPATGPLDAELKKFVEVFAMVEANAADHVDTRQAFFAGAIPGALRRLDPHSIFLDPDQYEQLKQMEKSERKGFGSVVSVLPGRVIILQTVTGSPSAKAGLSAGDEILAINNIPLARLELEQLIQLLTEARQREARLDVRRPGNMRMLQFVLIPELMEAPSVDRAYLLKPGVAYIRVANFDPKTADLMKSHIDRLGGAELHGLVVDFRNNPGGVVESALQMAAMFLQPDQKILSVKGRSVQGDEVSVPKNAKPYTFPLAVLINNKTASAAEIVTAALQDHQRATIVGEQSYGKGLVQSVYNLSSNSALALTTAFYYTPKGRSLQRPLEGVQLGSTIGSKKFGVDPDEVVGPAPVTRMRAVLDASGAITNFATEFTQRARITPEFEVTGALLDDLKVWLSQRGIQPPLSEWLTEKSWIETRLKQEIITLVYGVEKGDEIEAQRDPVVQRAISRLN